MVTDPAQIDILIQQARAVAEDVLRKHHDCIESTQECACPDEVQEAYERFFAAVTAPQPLQE